MRSYYPIVSALFIAIPVAVHAQKAEVNWPRQLSGLDGATVTCANANTEKYAAGICADMRERIVQMFREADLPITDLGDYFVKTKDRPAKPDELKTPLAITVYVRASNSDGVHAINLRNHVSVFYENAVQAGGEGDGRKGELVIWEGSTTGSGPRKQLSAAIVGASFQKLEEQLEQIVKAWPK